MLPRAQSESARTRCFLPTFDLSFRLISPSAPPLAGRLPAPASIAAARRHASYPSSLPASVEQGSNRVDGGWSIRNVRRGRRAPRRPSPNRVDGRLVDSQRPAAGFRLPEPEPDRTGPDRQRPGISPVLLRRPYGRHELFTRPTAAALRSRRPGPAAPGSRLRRGFRRPAAAPSRASSRGCRRRPRSRSSR